MTTSMARFAAIVRFNQIVDYVLAVLAVVRVAVDLEEVMEFLKGRSAHFDLCYTR